MLLEFAVAWVSIAIRLVLHIDGAFVGDLSFDLLGCSCYPVYKMLANYSSITHKFFSQSTHVFSCQASCLV